MITRLPPAAAIAGLAALALLPVCANPVRISVKDNRFVTPDGRAAVFRGMSTSDPAVMRSKEMWTPATFRAMRGWGANLVRFPIHPKSWRERGEEAYLTLLDQGIAMARAENLHVIIDWHSIGNLPEGRFFGGADSHPTDAYRTTIAESFAFWKTIARRYGDEPTVAFYELFNEPATGRGMGDVPWPRWRQLMEELISAIRAEGGKAVPLVAGFDFAYDLTQAAADPVRAEGIGYVSHPYPGKVADPARWNEQWTRDWGQLAGRFPVILTEIGFQYAGEKGGYTPIIGDDRYVDAITAYCDGRNISWVAWCFDDSWVPRLIADRNFTPTRSGALFRKALLAAADPSRTHAQPPISPTDETSRLPRPPRFPAQ